MAEKGGACPLGEAVLGHELRRDPVQHKVFAMLGIGSRRELSENPLNA